MKAKKIWIAVHPKDKYVYEVSLFGVDEDSVRLFSLEFGWAASKWKEYVYIEVED